MEEYDNAYGLCPNCGYEPDTDVDSPIHMKPGVLLHGRYLVGRVLGFGGFGVTYICWDFTLQQKVAIKEYLPSEFATRLIGHTQVSVFGGKKEEQFGDGMDQFVEEAKRLAQFQNEDGIVRIFDSFAENNTAYIVMEYLEGETLTAYLERNGKISFDDAVQMLTPALKSLEIIHKAGIIHRDIAPDNIFLTKDGKVKLIDFGAARYATTTHSRSLTVIIKPGYSPEEQYRSRGDQGPHTDVYAIAAVLYRMITGTVLPDSLERRTNFERSGKDIVVPASRNCQISKSQENAIMNALNVRIEDRTPTAAQFLEELTAKRPVKRIFGRIKPLDPTTWPLWAKIVIPTAAAVVAALLILLGTGTIGPNSNLITDIMLGENEARVPGVVNYTVDVAESRLAANNLTCQIIGTEYSDVIPANMVIYQNVTAGQVVEKDSIVEVYISTDQGGTGIEEGVMPNVVYKTQTEAETLLTQLGLTVKCDEVFDDIVAAGMVVAQSRDPGTSIASGDEVVLSISKGVDPNKEEATDEKVTLSRDTYDKLYVGDTVLLLAEGGDGTYKYESSNENVATVDRDGNLTAVGAGTATITVTSGSAEGASCSVTVRDYEMAMSRSSLTLFKDASATLSVTGIPSNAQVSWSSDNSKVATVNKNGKVTGVATGKATITATWKNTVSGKTYTAKATVKVEDAGITLSPYKISSFYVGETRTIKATTSGSQTIKWSSSNTKVATVNANGVVTAVGGGSATITATCGSYSETCSVTVTQPSISISQSNVSLYTTNTTTLTASVTPSGTAVTWSSDDNSIAKVSGGKVTAVSAGTTTIRAKMTYAGKTYESTCKISVGNPGITLSETSLSLNPGGSKTLSATTKPKDASVTWSSDNTGIAKVSGGKVTAVDAGTTTIRAKITYNGRAYEAICKVTVASPSVKLDKSSLSLMPGSSGTLKATTVPSGSSVSWSSSNTGIATVSGGTVKAVASGSATITAQISYNGKTYSAKCEVTVASPTISVTSSASTIEFSERDKGTAKLTAKVTPDGGKITWESSNTSVAKVSGDSTSATVTAVSAGSTTIKATYSVNGTTVTDSCEISVKQAASTLKVTDIRYPARSTVDNFYFDAKVSSNYQITKLYVSGKAVSNATGLSATDNATFTLDPGVYETGSAEATAITEFLKDRYRTLYNLYVGVAGILGADDSLTITIHSTFYDSSGNTYSFDINYVLDE